MFLPGHFRDMLYLLPQPPHTSTYNKNNIKYVRDIHVFPEDTSEENQDSDIAHFSLHSWKLR